MTAQDIIRAHLRAAGAKGGAATGKAKRRGGKAYYRALAIKAAASRKANRAAREAAAISSNEGERS